MRNRHRLLCLLTLLGCPSVPPPSSDHRADATASAKTPPEPTVAMTAPPPAPDAGPPKSGDCVDASRDIEQRVPGAKPVERSDLIDLDGDGVLDPAFTGSCTMMGGNCEHILYGSGRGCARFLGVVTVTRVSSGPRCAEPPRDGQPCRLSASRMMLHGEIYEYFYTYGPGGYVESGVGHRGERPPRGP